MFSGDIYITDDAQLAMSLALNPAYKVMAMCDDAAEIFGQNSPVFTVSYLLPPYSALEAENNGDADTFYSVYYNYLMSFDVESYITLLLAVLYKGVNILLYVNKDEGEGLLFVNAFMQFMYQYYGISIGCGENPPKFDANFSDICRVKMFRHGYITANDLLRNFTGQTIQDPEVCDLICREMNFETNDPITTVNNYIQHLRMNLKPVSPIPAPYYIR